MRDEPLKSGRRSSHLRRALGASLAASALLFASACDEPALGPADAALAKAGSVVVISPASPSVEVGGSVQLEARDANGNVVSVKWSSSNTAVASVDGAGKLTGRAPGTATITAASQGNRVTTDATVVQAAPVPVSSVAVSPGTLSLNVGDTGTLTATPKDANGNALTGRTVAWSSSNPGVATVGATGTVTAVGAGSATITATSEGKSGTAAVSVAAPSSGVATGECAAPKAGWIWCDDFEQDRLSRYFEYKSASGSFTRAASVGAQGSYGMRAHWAAGQVDAGALHLAFGRTPSTYMRPVDAGTANYREIYWRVYVRTEPTWSGGGGYKLSRATVFASSNWAQAMIAHHWSGGSTTFRLNLDPASGTDDQGNLRTTTYNDMANLRWLGAVQGTVPLYDASHVGQWYCVEAHVRLNDAGQANGVFESWINGVLDARKTGINWLGSYNQYGMNAVFLENYWNGGSPRAQERYLDNFVVSTQPIGCS